MLLEILQNSQESTFATVSFNIVAGLGHITPLDKCFKNRNYPGIDSLNFIYLPQRGGDSEKLKKRGWKYVAGEGLLKRRVGGGGGLALSIFNFFKVYHFYI